jgi:manganese oxidase
MKHFPFFLLLISLVLLVSACSSAVAVTPPAASTPVTEHDMSEMEVGETIPGGHGEAVPAEGVPLATEALGGQPLTYAQEGEVKVFELVAQTVRWPILENVYVTAWTYNGTVPGPMIRVTEGDKVRITLKNELPEATAIHWHGIPVPNEMDGVPPFTQKAIEPGETFTYEFTAAPAGTFMYHSHVETDKQIMLGLYAPFIIDPKTPAAQKPEVDEMLMVSEWTLGEHGETYPTMPMAGLEPNYFTINGKSFPETQSVTVKVGEVVRLRLAAIGQFTHPMHLHGASFKVVAIDGNPVPEVAQVTRDTITLNPGERYDIEFTATNPGTWVFHCHVLHHVTNNNVEPGGLIYVINVQS